MSSFSKKRHALLLGSAAVAWSLALPHAGYAQTPTNPQVTRGSNITFTPDNLAGTVTLSAGDPKNTSVDGVASDLTVDLGTNAASVITWDSFNVGSGGSVTFNGAPNASVLNRVTSPSSPSLINGLIRSDSNTSDVSDDINVWLVNPSGITFGAAGAFSGGSLFLTTADVDSDDFVNILGEASPSGDLAFSNSASGQAISLQAGAGIINASRSFVAVAQTIDSSKQLIAGNQVSLVAAKDLTLSFSPDSPLGITITEGTEVGSALIVNGAVAAKTISIVGASNSNELLIQLGNNLTASAADGRIFLGTKSSSDAATEVVINSGVGGDDGVRLTANVALTAATTTEISGPLNSDNVTPRALTLNGGVIFNGLVGNTAPLSALSVDGTSTFLSEGTTSTPSVTTIGDQVYKDAVVLEANAAYAAIAGDIIFEKTVDSKGPAPSNLYSLTTKTAATFETRFEGLVGGTFALSGLTVDGASSFAAAADPAGAPATYSVRTTGNQVYKDAVVLEANTAYRADAGNIIFEKTVDSKGPAAPDLYSLATFTTSPDYRTEFLDDVGDNAALASLSVSGIALLSPSNFNTIKTSGDQHYQGRVLIGANVNHLVSTDGNIAFDAAVDSLGGPYDLKTYAKGTTTFLGAVGGTAQLGKLAVNGSTSAPDPLDAGAVTIAANVNTADDYTVSGATVTLGTAGSEVLQASAKSVNITATTGDVTGLGTLTLQSNYLDDAASFGVTVTASGAGANIALGDAHLIGGAGDGSDGAPYTRLGTVSVASGAGGDVAFGAVDANNLVVTTGGTLTASGDITTKLAIALDAPEALSVAGLTTLDAAQNIHVNQGSGAGSATVAGPVTATGDYRVKGTTVTLGTAGSSVEQKARGFVGIQSTAGNITGRGTLTIQSNSAGTDDTKTLTVDAGTDAIVEGSGASGMDLLAGTEDAPATRADVLLKGVAGISVGDVRANALFTTDDSTKLASDGAITLGDVVVAQPLYIQTNGTNAHLTVGDVAVGNLDTPTQAATSLRLETLVAASDILANAAGGAALTAEGSVTLDAAGNIRLRRAESKTSSVSILANGDITGRETEPAFAPANELSVGRSVAGGNTAIIAQAGDIRIGGFDEAGDPIPTFSGVTSAGNVTVTASVGSVTGLGASAPGGAGAVVLAEEFAAIQADGNIALSSVSSANDYVLIVGKSLPRPASVAVGSLEAGSSVGVEALSGMSIGTINAGTDVSLLTTAGQAAEVSLSRPQDRLALDLDHGRASLTASGAAKTVTVSAGRIAQLGDVKAGSGTTAAAGLEQIKVEAAAIDITRALAFNGSLVLNATEGGLYLDRGYARDRALLTKLDTTDDGAGDVLRVTGQLIANGVGVTPGERAIVIRSAADALLAGTRVGPADADEASFVGTAQQAIAATAGGIGVTVTGDVTGLSAATGGGVSGFASGDGDDLVVGTLTSGGDATFAATLSDIRIGSATSNAGDLAVAAEAGSVTGTASDFAVTGPSGGAILNAATDIDVSAGGDAEFAELVAGGTITVNADSLTLGTATGSVIDLAATGALDIGSLDLSGAAVIDAGSAAIASIETDGDLTITTVNGLALGSASAGGTAALTNSGGIAGAPMLARALGTSALDTSHGRANLTALAEGKTVTVSALNGIAQLGDVKAGSGTAAAAGLGQVIVDAGAIDVSGARAFNGSIGLRAREGELWAANLYALEDIAGRGGAIVNVGTANAGDDLDLIAGRALTLGSGTARGDGADTAYVNIVLDGNASASPIAVVTTSELNGTALSTDTPAPTESQLLVNNRQLANIHLISTGSSVTAGALSAHNATADKARDVIVDAAAIATVTGDVTADRDYIVTGGTGVVLGDASARTQKAGRYVTITATTGNVTQGTGLLTLQSDSDGTGTANRSVNDRLYVSALGTGGNVTLANSHLVAGSGTTVGVGGTSDVFVDATNAVTLKDIDGRSIGLRARAGALDAANLYALEDIAGRAGTSLGATTANAGDDLDLIAGGALTLGSGTARGDGADTAYVNIVLDGNASASPIAVVTTSELNGTALANALPAPAERQLLIRNRQMANVTLRSNEIALNGDVTAANAIRLHNMATSNSLTSLGGSDTSGYSLTDSELSRLSAPDVMIVTERGAAVDVGQISLAATTGSKRFGILAGEDSAITLSGKISGGTSGTFEIGGDASQSVFGFDNPVLAGRIVGKAEAAGGGANIDLPNALLDLRAERIVFGLANITDQVDAGVQSIADNIVANANSTLYAAFADGSAGYFTPLNFIKADRMAVRYGDFALFQNTARTGLFGGVALGAKRPKNVAPAMPTLEIDAGGDAAINAFALFGQINGFENRDAGLLPEAVVTYSIDAGGRVVRIIQSNSRINGCVIGSPDKGCLVTDVPPPSLRIFDERQVQLFRAEDDVRVMLDPLIGTNNEGLIGDISAPTLGYQDPDCSGENCTTRGDQR